MFLNTQGTGVHFQRQKMYVIPPARKSAASCRVSRRCCLDPCTLPSSSVLFLPLQKGRGVFGRSTQGSRHSGKSSCSCLVLLSWHNVAIIVQPDLLLTFRTSTALYWTITAPALAPQAEGLKLRLERTVGLYISITRKRLNERLYNLNNDT